MNFDISWVLVFTGKSYLIIRASLFEQLVNHPTFFRSPPTGVIRFAPGVSFALVQKLARGVMEC